MERFEIVLRFGLGLHSASFLATDVICKQLVVLKLLDWPAIPTSSLVKEVCHPKLFYHEAWVMTLDVFLITSTCIVPKGLPFRPLSVVITEYCEEGNLDDWVSGNHRASAIHKITFFKRIVEALNNLHVMGLAHGNIKASNVVIKAGFPKLCDRMMVRGDGSRVVSVSPYSAPEVNLQRGESFTRFSDIFSLGVLLVQLFTEPHVFTKWMCSKESGEHSVFLSGSPDSPSCVKMPPMLNVSDSVLDLMKNMLNHCKVERPTSSSLNVYLSTFLEQPRLFLGVLPKQALLLDVLPKQALLLDVLPEQPESWEALQEEPKFSDAMPEQSPLSDAMPQHQVFFDAMPEQQEFSDALSEQPKFWDALTEQPKFWDALSEQPKFSDALSEPPKFWDALTEQPKFSKALSEQPKFLDAIPEQQEFSGAWSEQLESSEALLE